jgi:Fe-S cluster assembly protein SufD
MTHPRNLIVAGAGSQFTLIESHVGLNSGSYFSNSVTEIVAGEDSVIDYYRLQRESETGFHISSVHVVQERNSNFSAHSLSLGAALARNDFRVVLDAEGAECALNGLYAAQGRQHIDNHTWIDHAKPHCTSRELYKGILDHKSSAVFDGKILVRKDAQKTNSRQTNKNLLLSTEALVNSTPRLEIFADDVKCTHGATIGQLSEDELFYLRSRGIDGQTARTLLTYAFASDILSTVRIKPIQCQMDLLLLARLSRSGIDMRQFFAE